MLETLPAGLTVGHAHDTVGLTGCTAILFNQSVIAAADIRGSAPATCNFSALDPVHRYPRVNAILFTGGSSFGMSAANGVQEFLEARGLGFNVGVTTIPIVPTAGIFDLAVGDVHTRPDKAMGMNACLNASRDIPEQGSVGAGMGASVGKFYGVHQAMRGGFGVSSCVTAAGAEMFAFAVVNAFGDIWSPLSENIIAGARESSVSLQLANTEKLYTQGLHRAGYRAPSDERLADQKSAADDQPPMNNTTLIALITTAALDVLDARKLAQQCILGLADCVRPACTIFDGDLAIAASIGDIVEDLTVLCVLTRRITAEAIINAVQRATPTAMLPACSSLQFG